MVVSRTARKERHADDILRALADRTRRDLLRQAMSGTLSVSALARRYPMSTTAVQKHVAVLKKAGLVHLTRRGRQLFVQTEIGAVAEAQALLTEFERLWRDRLDRIGDVVAQLEKGDRS